MKTFKKVLPYLALSILTILYWKLATLTSRFAWEPKGKELLAIDISLTTIFIYEVIFWLIVLNLGLFAILNSNKHSKMSFSIILAVLLMVVFGRQLLKKELAFPYYVIFINQSVSEEFMERPILMGGYYVGEWLTKYIKDKDSTKRRYAISGLGKIKYSPGIETLRNILYDNEEKDFIRADSFKALELFDTRATDEIIEEFRDTGDPKVLRLVEAWKD